LTIVKIKGVKEMSPKIANAIVSVQQSVQKYEQDKKNSYGKYNYLGIDGYYEKLRPLLNNANISILCNEVSCDLVDSKYLKTTYEFSVLHKDGDYWESGIKRTVIVPYTGGQTCGSSLSYAEKFFLRTVFKIATGEIDKTQNDVEIENDALFEHDIDDMPTNTNEIENQLNKAKKTSEKKEVTKNNNSPSEYLKHLQDKPAIKSGK
jgi:hypothetical protein